MKHKLIILLLLFASLACAQRRDTIFQSLVVNQTTTGATSNVTNIGQSQHLFFVLLTNKPTLTCSQQSVAIRIEASYDNSSGSFFPIGTPLTAVAGSGGAQLSEIMVARGAFPYVRLNALAFDTTNCNLTVMYSGALAVSPPGFGIQEYTVPQIGRRNINNATMGQIIVADKHPTDPTLRVCMYGIYVRAMGATTISFQNGAAGTLLGGPHTLATGEVYDVGWGGHIVQCASPDTDIMLNNSANVQISGFLVFAYDFQ